MKEVRFSQMSLEDRNKLKTKLIGLLELLIAICEENDIRWFVGYGACIGAIRHKGCIPWDDDIDICMPRPDYDRFIKICKNKDLGDFELASIDNTPGYFEHVVRLCDKNSTILFSTLFPYVIGVFIDILPLDGANDGNVSCHYKRFVFWKKVSRFSRFLIPRKERVGLLRRGNILAYIVVVVTSLFRTPLQRISIKMIDRVLRWYSYETSEYCMYYTDVYGIRNLLLKKWVEESVFVPFENIQVRIPKHYHEYLTHIYGDYMTPPPEEKRDDRHTFAFVDLDKRLTRDEILKLLSK